MTSKPGGGGGGFRWVVDKLGPVVRVYLKAPSGRMETESGGTGRRTGGEVKGKEANGVGSQAVFNLTRNSPSSVTTIVLPRPALQESQYSTELTPPSI